MKSPVPGSASQDDPEGGAEPLEERIFGEALALPPRDRAGHVLRAARGDRAVAGRVLDLLAAHATAGSFLETPAVKPPSSASTAELREGPGTTIGPYELIEELGEGGFGVVYRARQTVPVRREVALKIIKLGMDTRQVIARFEAERQALAVLDHPHIARVLDAGATPTGRPYFVMELVEGVDIAKYCDERRLSPRARIEILMDVCGALQHAHQRGLIHRDLKPTNLLVTHREGRHVAKVIDFGIAKATTQRLTERTVFTELGQFIGTPVYMSPEQAEHGEAEVDTRSDIYSLGVVLYELLVGRPPFEAKDLRDRGLAEIQTFIREFEPAPPSTRVTRLGADTELVATARACAPKELVSELRGDLDWIVLKALEKDPDRRYESAAAFAADLGRHLANLPVHASPPSVLYRTQKFVRRHRLAVGAGAVVVAALLTGVALMLIGFVDARRSAAIAESRAEVLTDVLLAGSSDRDTRMSVSGESLLARFVAAFGTDHPGGAVVLQLEAERCEAEGRVSDALEAYGRALAEVSRVHGEGSREHLVLLAKSGQFQASNQLDDDALPMLLAALAGEEAAFERRTPRLNAARHALAEVLLRRGEVDEAMRLCRAALDVARECTPDDHVKRLQCASYYLQRAASNKRDAELGPVWLEAVELVDQIHPPGNPLRGDVRMQIAVWNRAAQVFDEVTIERILREALAEYGLDPNRSLASRGMCREQLATLLLEHGSAEDVEEGLQLSSLAIDDIRLSSGWNQALADALDTHAARLETHGRYARAIEATLEVIEVRRKLLGADTEVRKQKDALERLAQALMYDDRLETMHPDFLVGIEAVELLQRERDDLDYKMYGWLRDGLLLRSGDVGPVIDRMGGLMGFKKVDEAKHPYNLALAALGMSMSGRRARAASMLEEALALAAEPQFANDRTTQEMVSFVRKMLTAKD